MSCRCNRLVSTITFIIALISLTSHSLSQTAAITGRVSDIESGEGLPGANIVLQAPTLQTGTATSQSGAFELLNLPADVYTLSITYIGYEAYKTTTFVLRQGKTEVLDIRLTPVGIRVNPVTVTASRRREKLLDAPASVSVVEARNIEHRAALTPTEHLKAIPAVDIVTAGLNQSRVVVRGFNDLFSGSLLSMVDNRITRIPAVRLNAFQLISTSNMDVERIEVVSGPASALYGPNSAQGVMHVLTKSPFDSRGTAVSIGGGERNVLLGTMRHAGVWRHNIGYKLSVQYYEGDDFESVDPLELAALDAARRTASPDTARIAARVFDIKSTNLDARVDWRLRPGLTFILNSGFSRGDNIEITDQGAAQALNASFAYLQGRLLYKNLFLQAFINKINTGDTYLLRTGQRLVNRSSLVVTQAQHHVSFGDWQHLTYGLDILLTRPVTDGTVNGINENHDDVNEVGLYLQSETALSKKLKLITAARLDDHNRLQGVNFSPRAALVFKPTPVHNFRLTFNRAFSTPTSDHLFSDIDARTVPTLSIPNGEFLQPFIGDTFVNIRSLGTWPNGFTFRYDENSRPMMISAFSPEPEYLPATVNSIWPELRASVLAGTPEFLRATFDARLPLTLSQTVPGIYKAINLEAEGEADAFKPVESSFVQDIRPTFEMTNTTFEFGFKGLLTRKFLASIDLYHSRIKNFIGPLTVETPSVFVDPEELERVLRQDMRSNGVSGQDISIIAPLVAQNLAALPIGLVSPTQVKNGTDIIITNRNLGDVSVSGADLSLAYYLNPHWVVTGNYSYINRDFFKSSMGYHDIALNAPKHKVGALLNYQAENDKFTGSLRLRFVDGFPVNSGIFVGKVDRYTILDLNASYRPPFAKRTNLSLTIQNLMNNKHKEFVGVPEIGRLALARLTRTL